MVRGVIWLGDWMYAWRGIRDSGGGGDLWLLAWDRKGR
jgi:hypothetical protein